MKYIRFEVETTREGSELIADALSDIKGFSGVSIFDPEDVLDAGKGAAKYDYIDETLLNADSGVKVFGFFSSNDLNSPLLTPHSSLFLDFSTKIEKKLRALKKRSEFDLGSLAASISTVDDAEWADVWKKHYKTQKYGDFTVAPCWEDVSGLKRGSFIVLDPGAAFGTGEHETTRSCIELILALRDEGYLTRGDGATVPEGKSFIDLGCGSGILGLAAALYGCGRVDMIDLDPVAVSAAAGNLKFNLKYYPEFENKVNVIEGDLFEKAEITADIIAANISSDILTANAKNITAHLNAGGRLILSGIINSRADEVFGAYRELGFTVLRHISMGEWNAALLHK